MNLTKKFFRVIAFVLFAVIALQLPVVALARELQPGITDNAISTTLSGDDAHILSEDATLRDEYTKHFVLSDGSMLAASYSVPVHYYKNDEWKDIDNTLVSENAKTGSDIRGFVNTESGVKYKFAQSSAEAALLEMTADGYSVSWELVADKNTVAASVTNPEEQNGNSDDDILNGNKNISSVKYINILNDTDIEYILRGNDVKENITVKSAKDNYTYSFRIRVNGAALVLKEDGSIDIVKGGETVKTIPAAFMTDAAGAYSADVETTLVTESDGVYMLTVTADKTWVNNAQFPVTIDPQLNDTDTVKYTVTKTQLTQNGGENLGDGVVWAGHSAATDKKARFHVSVPINYMVGFDDYIISAKINLVRNSASDGKGNVVIGAYAATTYFNKNNAHYDSVGMSNVSSDKVLINNSDTENTVYGVDITSIVRMWMRNESENKGLVIDADNVGGADAYAAFDAATSVIAPACVIRYRSAHGLVDGFSYYKTSLGNGGIAYVNKTTGNLVVVRDDVLCLLNGKTTNISGVYNSIMPAYFSGNNDFYGTQMKSGNGWKLNVQEKITGMEYSNTGLYYEGEILYTYVDATGAKYYFALVERNPQTNEFIMKDTAGLGMTLSYLSGRQMQEDFILTDKDGNTKSFDASGYMLRDKEKQGTKVEITYTGTYYSTRCITSLTDIYGTTNIEYNSDRTVKSVTDRLGNTINYTYDANGNLISISDGEGTLVTYAYNGTKLVSAVDEQNHIKVTFSYNGELISRIESFDTSSDTEFKTESTSFSFEDGRSVISFLEREKGEDGQVEEVTSEALNFFDERGRLSALVEDGNVTTYTYDDNSEFFNNVKTSATFDNLSNNFLSDCNGSAYNFTEYGTNAGGSVALNTSFVYTGSDSLSVTSAAITDIYGYAKTIMVGESGTYTFRAFAKPGDLTVSESSDGGAALKIINNTTSASAMSEFVKTPTEAANNNGWSLVSVSIECAAGDSVTLVAGIENATGTALFDGLNFDKGEAISVNLLSNNGFENGLDGWTPTGFVADNSAKTGTKSIISSENTSAISSAFTTAYIGLSAERSFTLSGWVKGNIVKNNGTAFIGLKAKVYYTVTENGVSEQKTAEYTVSPSVSSDGWQFVSTTFVPPQAENGQTVTVDRIDVYAISENNLYRVLFDDISLVMNAAECYEYNENGDVLAEDDFLGNKTNYNYGADGRLSATATEYTQTNYAYDDTAKTTTQTSVVYDAPVTAETRNKIFENISRFDRYDNLIYINATEMQSGLSEISSYVYDDNCNNIISETDSSGNTKSYTYNDNGNKTSETNEAGVVKRYEYNADAKLELEYTDENNNEAFDDGEKYVSYTYNANGALSSTTSNNSEYSYVYDSDAETIKAVKIGDFTVVSYEYNGDDVSKITYSNGDYVSYTYTANGDNDKIRYYSADDTLVYEISYTYNSDGMPLDIVNSSAKSRYHFVYNEEDDIEKIEFISDKTEPQTVIAVFQTSFIGVEIPGNFISFGNVKLEYTETSDENTSTVTLKNTFDATSPDDILSITETRDTFNRVSSDTVSANGAVISRTYEYVNGNVENTDTLTEKVERIVYSDGTVLKHEYDALDRIVAISAGTTDSNSYAVKEAYVYDIHGRLVRNDSADINKTFVYEYDNNGNILSKKEYAYTTGNITQSTPLSTVNYTYTDSVWKDKMTSYNGTAITYDNTGNPLSYRDGLAFGWCGRNMSSLTNGTTSASYEYNEDGIRLSKTVNGVTTAFVLDGRNIAANAKLTDNGVEYVYFYYDAAGTLVGMNYRGNDYLYKKNLQGDIVEIWGTEDGTDNHAFRRLVEYKYDAWGKQIAVNDLTASDFKLGEVNPFRYRGYYFDTESGLYYLQSRYYDPVTGRFINSDAPMTTMLSAGNLYCYCSDDPVNKTDASGYLDWDISYAMRAFYHVAGKDYLSDLEQVIYDLNGDGVVDITDAMILFYYVAKKDMNARARIRYINQHARNPYHRDDDWGKYYNWTSTCAMAALSMSLQGMNYPIWKPKDIIASQSGSVRFNNYYFNKSIKIDVKRVNFSKRQEIDEIKKCLDRARKSPRLFGLPICSYKAFDHWVLVCGVDAKGNYVILDPGIPNHLRMKPGGFYSIKTPFR